MASCFGRFMSCANISNCRFSSSFSSKLLYPCKTFLGRRHQCCRLFSGLSKGEGGALWESYRNLKRDTEAKALPNDQDPEAVYANNELNLKEIDVYGFDYDYTVAMYNEGLDRLIYDLGRDILISENKYPKNIAQPEYGFHPHFAMRGLHVDVKKGYLLKIDAFHNIQRGTVYRGLHPVSDEEVFDTYKGFHIDCENLSGFYGVGPRLYQLMDLFAIPEMNLYANINEFFIKHDISYDPECVFFDVRTAIGNLHKFGVIHKAIQENLDKYLTNQPEIFHLLQRLSKEGKKMFLITNSAFNFVDKGMSFLVGLNWMQMFDVIITNASKPKFFHDSNRHFRMYDPKLGVKSWNKVEKLDRGCIYQGGNFFELINITGWSGNQVLYIGDHVYTDLADATLKLGWRTGAIIPELKSEIMTMNSVDYKKAFTWLMALEGLINRMQIFEDPESLAILAEWQKERHELRYLGYITDCIGFGKDDGDSPLEITKNVFNPQFGSIFRTYHNPSYFSRRFRTFADIYMSSVVNLLNYSLSHTFYPRRSALSHELDFESGL